jgi:uncharacterized protein YcbX
MLMEIGQVEAIFRYPVKSMGGEQLEAANLGWHGLDGDRRLAFRRIDDRSGFPWLTASKLPDLLLFTPHRREDGAQGDLPTHIRTPDGEEMSAPTCGDFARMSSFVYCDRFRSRRTSGWAVCSHSARVTTPPPSPSRCGDARCSMVNLDPDSASPAPEVLKAVVRANQNNTGIYGAVSRIGRLAVGQTIFLRAATEKGERG